MKPYQKATRKGCGLCRDREARGRPEEKKELRRAVVEAESVQPVPPKASFAVTVTIGEVRRGSPAPISEDEAEQ